MATVTIGANIGQKVDPTAITVCEVDWREQAGRREDYHLVRFLERLLLGTPYPQVAQRVEAVVADVHKYAAGSNGRARASRATVTLYCDATGVGMPVVDLLKHTHVLVQPVFCGPHHAAH